MQWNHWLRRPAQPLVRRSTPRLAVVGLEDRVVPAQLTSFLTAQHVDLNIGRTAITGEWSLEAMDGDNNVAHGLDEALLYTGIHTPTTQQPGFEFVGAGNGNQYFRLPQSQNPELLYLGFSGYDVDTPNVDRYTLTSESNGRLNSSGRWVKVSLLDVKHVNPDGTPGKGAFSVWQGEDFGPNVFMTSFNDGANNLVNLNPANANSVPFDLTDGIGANDALWIVADGHIHYNWGFTQPGRYEIQFQTSAYFGDNVDNQTPNLAGFSESDPFTVTFSVGSVGRVQFESASTAVNEQAGYRTVLVNRVGGSDGQLAINYNTTDGTGVAGGDYVASSGTLVFADGETQKAITVQIAADAAIEAGETFNLTLSVPASTVAGDTGDLNSYLLDATSVGVLGTITTTTLTINDSPTVSTVSSQATVIGTATAAIPFTIGDAETSAGALTVTATSSNPTLVPASGIVLGGSGAGRSITLTPVAALTGTAQITVIATDAGGATAVRQFTLAVGSSVPIPAMIPSVVLTADDSYTLNYTISDATWVTSVSRSNTALFNTPSTSSSSDLRTQPSSGGATRTLRIRPKDNSTSAGSYGSSTVTLAFTGAGVPSDQTFAVRVNPRAVADNQLLAIPGTTSTFDVLANDAAPIAGHTFTITSVSAPAHGTLSIGGGGQFVRYTPTTLSTGFDTFTYTVTVSSSDEFNGATFSAIGSVKIGGYVVIDSATASQHTDLAINYRNGEWIKNIHSDAVVNGAVQSGTFSPTVLDSDEGLLFLDPSTKIARPANNASYNFDFMGVAAGKDIWLGPTSQTGNKLYLGFSSEETTVGAASEVIDWTPVGDPRATVSAPWIKTQLVEFSGPGFFSAYDLGDTNGRVYFDTADGVNSISDSGVGSNVNDTFWGFAGSHAHINWVFTQPGRYALTFESTTKIATGFTTSPRVTYYFDVDTISGNVRLGENPPIAQPDSVTVNEDSATATINVLANDSSSPDPLELFTVTAVTPGSHGGKVAVGTAGANVKYTPAADFFGIETFTYTITDEHGGTANQTVSVTVTGLPDSPLAAADAYAISAGNLLRANVLANDRDVDGDAITAVPGSGPAHGVLAFNANGSFTYTPGVTFAGSDSFTYTAFDGALSSAVATVSITAAGFQDFAAIISEGPTDIGVAYENDAWDLHVHDEENDVEYEPQEVLITVGATGLTTRPAGAAYDFIGVAAGAAIYQIPEIEIPDLTYLGFGLEEIDDGVFVGNEVQVRLLAVNGPGQVSVWRGGVTPSVAWATSDGITAADNTTFPTGAHEHYNFSFTAPGRYEVTIEAIGTLVGDIAPTFSGPVTYYFSVDNLGQLQFATPTYSVTEGGTVTMTVNRIGGSDGPLTVNYAPTGGSATSGDYSGAAGSVTFADGETTRTIVVAAIGDAFVEGSETVLLTLTAPAGSPTAIGSPASTTLTISDAAAAPSVVSVQINGGTVQRSRVTTLAVTFSTEVAIAAGAFSLGGFGLDGNAVSVGAVNFTTAVVDGKTVATLSFSGAGTDFGSLQDGNWILTVAASGVSAGSVPMTANYSTPTSGPGSIHRLFGDINGDRTVEGGGDFSQFGAAFGSSVGNPLYLAAFDFNLDGTIEGGADFSEFGNRFGLSL